jgi:molybdenum cofactor cytidylyltransferase
VIAGLVLAAGQSSRMGRPKQILPVGGKPMLRHAIDAAVAAGLPEVVVVFGPGAEAAMAESARGETTGVRPVWNPESRSGQASSLRAGLDAMPDGAEAAVVLLADQPTVRADAIRAVMAAFRGGEGPIVQASYGGVAAHPTLLARSVWPEVMAVSGDEGARALIATHPEWRAVAEVGGEPPEDVDTPEDLKRMRSAFEPG